MIDAAPSGLGSPGPSEEPAATTPFAFTPLRESRALRAAARWTVLIVAVAAGFHRTLQNFFRMSLNGDPGVYRVLIPLFMIMCVVGVTRRPVVRIKVFDRNLDALVALLLAILGIAIRVFITPRLGETAAIWGISEMIMALFVLIGVIILWGLRTAWRYRLADLLILGFCPLPFLLVGAVLGGTDVIYGCLSVFISVVYYLLAAGFLRSWLAAAVATVGGVVMVLGFNHLKVESLVTQLVPAAIVSVALIGMIIHSGISHFNELTPEQGTTQRMPLALGLVIVAVTGLVFGVIEAGQTLRQPPQAAPAELPGCSQPPSIPGYIVKSRSSLAWAPKYFGPGATWERAVYVTTQHQKIPSLAIDLVQTSRAANLINYPPQLTYAGGLLAVQGEPTSVLGVPAQRAYSNSNKAVDPANLSWLQISLGWRNTRQRMQTVERLVVSVPQTLPGINLLPGPVQPAKSGVLTGAVGRLVASAPTYLIQPAQSVDRQAHLVAAEVLTKAENQQGACR